MERISSVALLLPTLQTFNIWFNLGHVLDACNLVRHPWLHGSMSQAQCYSLLRAGANQRRPHEHAEAFLFLVQAVIRFNGALLVAASALGLYSLFFLRFDQRHAAHLFAALQWGLFVAIGANMNHLTSFGYAEVYPTSEITNAWRYDYIVMPAISITNFIAFLLSHRAAPVDGTVALDTLESLIARLESFSARNKQA